MDFLQLADKKIVVFGLANRKSVACGIAKVLQEAGAEIIHVVRSPVRKETAEKLFPHSKVFICDVENEKNIARVKNELQRLLMERFTVLYTQLPLQTMQTASCRFTKQTKKIFSRRLIFRVFHLLPYANILRIFLMPTVRL